jgi:protein-disulfide isomerase
VLHEQYVDPGLVYWKTVPFVTGTWPASLPVSLAAECARAQGRSDFEAISDLIFEHQSDWKAASAPEELAEAYAEEAGLDMQSYRTCIESDELLWRVQLQTALATEMGIRGTPTFILDGWQPLLGALPLEGFQMVFDTTLVEIAAQQR